MSHSVFTYTWKGINQTGKTVSGKMSAATEKDVKRILRKQRISPTAIKLVKSSFSRKAKMTAAEVSVLTRQIATMLGAGVSLIQTLDMVGKGQEKPDGVQMLSAISADVKAGNQLSTALRKFPKHFDDLYCDLVFTGEQSGALETLFDRIATYKEKAEALKSKIKKAMFYPIAVVVVALIVTTILLIYVVPQFKDIFSSFGAELPVFTQMVLNLSDFIQTQGALLFAVIAILIWCIKLQLSRSKKTRDKLDCWLLKTPVIGVILEKAAIARLTRTLATTFAAGVPLPQALDSAAGASGNSIYRDACLFVKKEVSGGVQMNQAMLATSVFPNMVIQMVTIGEESGTVDNMLEKIASIFEAQVDDLVDGLTSLLEPIIMAVLGVVIGGLIIAMYLPIFEMGNVV